MNHRISFVVVWERFIDMTLPMAVLLYIKISTYGFIPIHTYQCRVPDYFHGTNRMSYLNFV